MLVVVCADRELSNPSCDGQGYNGSGFCFFPLSSPNKAQDYRLRCSFVKQRRLLQEENNLQLNFENFCPRASSHQPEMVSEALRGHSWAVGLRTPAAGLLLGNSRESACSREGVPERPACVTVWSWFWGLLKGLCLTTLKEPPLTKFMGIFNTFLDSFTLP